MRRRALLVALVCLDGCVGTLDDLVSPPGGGDVDAEEARLRRLSPVQYRNTVRDLLALSEAEAGLVEIPTDESVLPSLLTVGRLDDAAAYLTSLGVHRRLVPCDVAGEGDPACATACQSDAPSTSSARGRMSSSSFAM